MYRSICIHVPSKDIGDIKVRFVLYIAYISSKISLRSVFIHNAMGCYMGVTEWQTGKKFQITRFVL